MLGPGAFLHEPGDVFRWLPRACIIVAGPREPISDGECLWSTYSSDAKTFRIIGTDEMRCPGSLGQRSDETLT